MSFAGASCDLMYTDPTVMKTYNRGNMFPECWTSSYKSALVRPLFVSSLKNDSSCLSSSNVLMSKSRVKDANSHLPLLKETHQPRTTQAANKRRPQSTSLSTTNTTLSHTTDLLLQKALTSKSNSKPQPKIQILHS
ncbi:hypothetical protein M758_UG217500 [Ceratodon purpureus]|uniref:Uncharacterized protein n=1 Tax=Ceratodon purpureus TaxID=3225 RepID=A0A8T0J5Y9_CERPU|nr:hypothetical protein KC19_1G089600 [Ceratodon purpureus]KAG0590477.1 hypothetical protein KC19_1G102400 [Ceratodon purpureus]KAG0590652.1 hypothetical protein KC19_1G116800 [Ceratodon purpureus]KAG0596024.1 hypothetical protein M758_UG217500 [Ceratodon purpureus]